LKQPASRRRQSGKGRQQSQDTNAWIETCRYTGRDFRCADPAPSGDCRAVSRNRRIAAMPLQSSIHTLAASFSATTVPGDCRLSGSMA
jgi:hypothetical protein